MKVYLFKGGSGFIYAILYCTCTADNLSLSSCPSGGGGDICKVGIIS